MRARSGTTVAAFHAGNVAMHIVPAALAVVRPPRAITMVDVCAAHLVFTTWGMWASGGTMLYDAIYVGLAPVVWHAAQACALAAMLLYAHVFGSTC